MQGVSHTLTSSKISAVYDPFAHHTEHVEESMPYYRTDRGIQFAFAEGDLPHTSPSRYIDFNPFIYLANLISESPDRKIEVLEGGCGTGQALVDLKLGVFGDSETGYYRGLGHRIRTTGVTLNQMHVLNQAGADSDFAIDDMRVGPVHCQTFDVEFDLIYDFYGAGFYFPSETIPAYHRFLRLGGHIFARVTQSDIGRIEDWADQSGLLEVVKSEGGGHKDLLLKKVSE